MQQKVSKDIKDQNNTINQFDLTDIYQKIPQAMAKYMFVFFSQVHMEHSPKETIRRAIKQCLMNLEQWNYPESILTKLKLLETGNIKISEKSLKTWKLKHFN